MKKYLKSNKIRVLLALLLVLAAVVSFVRLGSTLGEPEYYGNVIASIDKKSSDALKLTGIVTVASAGLTILPDDIATPVAEEIAEFTDYFLIALCVLYAEKYMLPIIGLAVFKFLIPLVCILGILWLTSEKARIAGRVAMRLLVFSLILWVAVPASIRVSDMIYETYENSIQSTVRKAEDLTEDVSLFSEESGTTFIERATDLLNNLTQLLAVTVATTCVIPILMLLLFFWLAKILLKVNPGGFLPRLRHPERQLPDTQERP